MRPPRPIPQFISAFPPPLNKGVLSCSGSVRDEILGAIKLYSEVNEFGRELLRANGHAKPATAFPRFQAYIRQANTFFEAAEVLHPRASPLNYYYAFMNFAKALILLKDSKFVDQRLTHGLAPNSSGGSLRRQFVHVARKGVYPLFHRHVTGKTPKPQLRMRAVDLLSYCTDVGF